MSLSNNAKSGDNSVSISGENNQVTFNSFNENKLHILKRTAIFEICQRIANIQIDYDDEYSIQHNSDWMDKFAYNNVNTYVEIFDNYSDGYDEVSEILQSYLNKTKMVKKVRTLYLEIEKVRFERKLDGDYVLDQLFKKLKEEVCYSASFNTVDLLDEDVDEAIYLIMFYVFTKCKILKPIPEEFNEDDNW